MRASAEKFTHTHADIHCMKVSSSCCDSLVLTHSHVLASGTSRFRLQSAMQPKGIHSNEWKTKKMGGKKEEENNEVWSEARSERVNLLKWTRKWAGGGGTGGGGGKRKMMQSCFTPFVVCSRWEDEDGSISPKAYNLYRSPLCLGFTYFFPLPMPIYVLSVTASYPRRRLFPGTVSPIKL